MTSPSQYKDRNYKVEHTKFFLDPARQKKCTIAGNSCESRSEKPLHVTLPAFAL